MSPMEIKQDHTQGTITLDENLVASQVPELKTAMKGLLEQGVTHLEVDFTQVKIVDSSGIGCLIAAHNSLVKIGGGLTVFGVSADIFELFSSMRLNRHFTIKPIA